MWRNLPCGGILNSEITLHVEKFNISVVLSRFALFCVEKKLEQNYICGEKMTHIRYAATIAMHCVTSPSQQFHKRIGFLMLCFPAHCPPKANAPFSSYFQALGEHCKTKIHPSVPTTSFSTSTQLQAAAYGSISQHLL